MPRDVPGLSLTHTAYERLRADLLACRMRPGERIRINELCRTLAVSQSAVREALSRLTSEGLVVARPQRGFIVTPVSAADLRDLTAVRIEIESSCLRRAIVAGDVAWESALVAAEHRLARTPERDVDDDHRVAEAWAQAHNAYHRALVAGGNSPWMLQLRELLYSQTERYRRLSVPLARRKRNLVREHRDIAKAAIARDAETAVRLLASHMEATTAILIEAAL